MYDNFELCPTVKYLEPLTRTRRLKDSAGLQKAVRLWIILRSLYGSDLDPIKLQLPNPFTVSEWWSTLKATVELDAGQPLSKITLAQWLFETGDLCVEREQWLSEFEQSYAVNKNEVEQLERDLETKSPFVLLDSGQLVSQRTLRNDFKTLSERPRPFFRPGEQQINGERTITLNYCRVEELPRENFEGADLKPIEALTKPDLGEIFESLCRPLNGIQRFFLYVDYVVPPDVSDRVSDWQAELKEIWQQEPVPPLRARYNSASLGLAAQAQVMKTVVVFPVCLYYAYRAPYLCAFGQTPHGATCEWYNYRLDRIEELETLTWDDSTVPERLRQHYQQGKLYQPEDIQHQMDGEAWGFDFYRDRDTLLLRFDRDFHNAYIVDTQRHETFIPIHKLATVEQMVRDADLKLEHRQALLTGIHSHREDAYYRAEYRVEDNNIIMRLRAWGPRVEVLLPWNLRQRMHEESYATWRLYEDKKW